ncbi:O-methyltransferase MdmC-like [Babylonia areolata]|uniref:O-methyltransferase MdmC-like n=1 Tax=Babylonia areolata TaxID=304850 RepID=UPI003FD24723
MSEPAAILTPHPALRRYQDPALLELMDVLELAQSTGADPQVVEGIRKVLHHVDLREDFTLRSSSDESGVCRKVAQETVDMQWSELKEQGKTSMTLTPKMLSGRLEGQFLKSILSAQRARRVLDVGMYTGYSALCMAEALPADGHLVTLDREPYLKERNQAVFDSVPHGKKITIKIGNALDSMKELLKEGRQFDFIFLDAQKSEYIDYLKLCFEEGLLAENGTVAVDNAYLHGANYYPLDKPPSASRLFGEFVAKDSRLHKILVPMRDGVLLIRRLNEVEPDILH